MRDEQVADIKPVKIETSSKTDEMMEYTLETTTMEYRGDSDDGRCGCGGLTTTDEICDDRIWFGQQWIKHLRWYIYYIYGLKNAQPWE
mmetsp:Transcript_32288/g.36736  ORF Transcript_32288/g.36736 Transcript_32288/m.36736 type:complete len:88 (-) Transcript_32288:320-583(-)